MSRLSNVKIELFIGVFLALSSRLATPEEKPEDLAKCLRISRHKALAQGGFGGTSEREADEEGTPGAGAPEEALPGDRADPGTIPSVARTVRSESRLRPEKLEASLTPEKSTRKVETRRP